MPFQTPRRLAVGDAAAYVGLSVSNLGKLRLNGGGPAYLKLGRRVVYDVADLDDWLGAHRRQATSPHGGDKA